jgi:ubiquinone/menaquinone biosynthesis C-methylase UbiE
VDITALCFPSECFDVIVCNHVLEHVPEDRKALSELHRVLKKGGWGSIQVPIKGKETQEDLSVIDPAERERRYGQFDHVRQYGEDFRDRLQEAGFDVLELRKGELLDSAALERLSVDCEQSVMLVRKPPAQEKQACPA